MFISLADWIGSRTCCSRVGARPSHMKSTPQAELMMVGDRRSSFAMPRPAPSASPSPQPKPGGMTARAGLRRRRREARIEIQLLAERGLGQRIGVLFGKRDKYRTPIFGLHRVGVRSRRGLNGNSTRLSDDRRSQRDIDKSDRGGDDGGADQARTNDNGG